MPAIDRSFSLSLSLIAGAAAAAAAGDGDAAADDHRDDNTNTGLDDYYRYCIVGGGAGGLQLGHFMAADGSDYVI